MARQRANVMDIGTTVATPRKPRRRRTTNAGTHIPGVRPGAATGLPGGTVSLYDEACLNARINGLVEGFAAARGIEPTPAWKKKHFGVLA
jgi:hypothetical protein